jgi:hypothetical protein
LLTEKYVTTKNTPLYKNVMLSGYYDAQLPKGDTLYAKDLFEKCIAIKIDRKKRYMVTNDLKRIELAKEELIVSQTSLLPAFEQQFLYKDLNY